MEAPTFLMDLCLLMDDERFRHFQEKYLDQWSDVETLFLYIYMFSYLQKRYQLKFGQPMEKDKMILLLQHIFKDKILRERAVLLFRQYQQDGVTGLSNHVFQSIPPNSNKDKEMERTVSFSSLLS